MINPILPSHNWFVIAKEIIWLAKKQTNIQDFKINAQLKPFKIGDSYTYRYDILKQLINIGVIKIVDERLCVGSTNNVVWLTNALKNGSVEAWDFLESVEGFQSEHKRFSQDILKEIGDLGELFVIEKLKEELTSEIHDQIIHVSQTDDTIGFDIYSPSVNNSDLSFKIEVKTSTRNLQESVEFYLSRNEYEVGRSNRNWCIVFVAVKEGEKKILGHIYCYQIESRLPKDVDELAKWESCKILISYDLIRDGLP